MVIGLLTLAAIPSVAAVSLGISERSKPETAAREKARLRKFTLTCWCAGRSPGKATVHGGNVVLSEGKMWIQSRRDTKRGEQEEGGGEEGGGGGDRQGKSQGSAGEEEDSGIHAFDGFYLDYPDEQRPPPAPTGLVSMVSQSPPTMNWIYVDVDTGALRHGNRTQSRRHRVGNFGWSSEEEDDFESESGGLTLDGDELFVAVQPAKGSREESRGFWEVFWDRNDDRMQGNSAVRGRLVLRISLERSFIEEAGSLQE